MKKVFCFLFLSSFLLQLYSQESLHQADSIRKYRSIPGLAYAVFTDEKILEVGASGVLRLKSREPVKVTNRFQIGTTTTAFTGYVAARLIEQKKMSWNTRIIDVFPELDGKIMKLYHKVTLFQLLSNRAGIPPYSEINDYRPIHSLPGSPVQQRKVFMTMVLKQRPMLVLDSSKVVYSIAGTAIAAAMMEKISGKSWEELIVEYINKPLGINLGFGFPNAKDSTEPAGHWDVYGALTAEANTYWAQFFPPIAPAGNINLSVSEYAKFLQVILKSLENKKSYLTPESSNYLLFGLRDNSIGWKNSLWNNYHVATWIGRAPVFSSYVEVIKEKNIGIVVLGNSGTSMGRAGVMNLGKLLRQHYVPE